MTSVREESQPTSGKTFVEHGTERLAALCSGAGAAALAADLCPLFESALQPWGAQRIGHRPRYRSTIADDEAPFEFSVALSSGPPEIQFYVEAQGDPPTLETNLRAGRELVERLALGAGASLSRLRAIEALFFPAHPRGTFTIWTGASGASGKGVRLKAYLNPQVCGKQAAPGLLGEAMARLGLEAPWARVQSVLSGDGSAEVSILSLDLNDDADARVKVYVRHHGGHLANIRRLAGTAKDYVADDVAPFYETLGAGSASFDEKPPITELTLTTTCEDAPSSVTLEFPIGKYAASDEVARARIGDCLARFGLSAARYDDVLAAFATRSPSLTRGIQAHVTLRRLSGQARVAVYFASGAYPSSATTAVEEP